MMKKAVLVVMAIFVFGVFFTTPCFSATYDTTGAWNFSTSNNWASSGCEPDENDTGTVTMSQNGNSFTMAVVGERITFTGTVSGAVYTGSASFSDEEEGTTTINMTLILSSSSTGAGILSWNRTDGVNSCNGGGNLALTKQSGGDGGGAVIGNLVTTGLWIGAVINTVEKGPIEALWKKGGEDTTAAGDRVIWGYFYASPMDVTWGNVNNPDLYVKIWFDHSGRLDVNFFHVSVPDIDVYSDYPSDGTSDEHGTTTMSTRYIRQYYENGGHHSEAH